MSAHGIRPIEGRVAHPPKGDSASALITRDRERVDGGGVHDARPRGRLREVARSARSSTRWRRCRPTYGRTWSSRKLFDPLLIPSAGSP
jgi:hypothetical protein